jgi:hypothetical protein
VKHLREQSGQKIKKQSMLVVSMKSSSNKRRMITHRQHTASRSGKHFGKPNVGS